MDESVRVYLASVSDLTMSMCLEIEHASLITGLHWDFSPITEDCDTQ